jgi:hypothetical protein
MEEGLVAFLLASAGLTALVGNRIDWASRVAGSPTPSVVLTVVSVDRDYHGRGASGLVATRVQVDCWAKDYSASLAVSREIRTLLNGYRGPMGAAQVQGTFLASERQSFEQGSGGEDFYRVSIDIFLHYQEN